MGIRNVTTWLFNIFGKDKQYQMKQENGLKYANQSFFNKPMGERLCDRCKTPYKEGALDFLSDEFVCPICENGKDD